MKVGIVGGGLFGSIIAAALAKKGADVTIYDDARPLRGSAPAGCVMKPEWYAGMGQDGKDALKLLRELYDVKDVTFRTTLKVGHFTCQRILPEDILEKPFPGVRRVKAKVHGIADMVSGKRGIEFEPFPTRGILTEEFDFIVLAAGIWCSELYRGAEQTPQYGMSFEDDAETEAEYDMWAPFKQRVKFTIRPGQSWIGEGSALLEKSFFKKKDEILARCAAFLGRTPARSMVGIRPYAKGKGAGWVEELEPGLWIATGGAKNGTIYAGHAARVISEALLG